MTMTCPLGGVTSNAADAAMEERFVVCVNNSVLVSRVGRVRFARVAMTVLG